MLAATGGHDVVKAVEKGAGLVPPIQAAPSSPKVLTYRVIARLLASLVDDRHSWDVRSGWNEEAGDARPELSEFGLLETRGKTPRDFWLLIRDDDAIAGLGVDGTVETLTSPAIEMLGGYRQSGSLTTVIGHLFGDVLP